MGCDIHGRVQVKRWGDQWCDVGEMPRDRNYGLFGALANVRQYSEDPADYISDARGLPADVKLDPEDDTSVMVETEFWQGDEPVTCSYWIGDHSHSWLTVDEVLNWDGWDKQYGAGSTLRKHCEDVLIYCQYIKARWGDKEARFIFGFDN